MSLSESEMMLDENYVPKSGSPLCNAGRADLYATFPADVAEALSKTDLAGGQRVYDGAIDIGAFEHDARGDFARILGFSGVEVLSASPDVSASGSSLLVPSGSSIAIDWNLARDGKYTFYVVPSGEGIVSVTLEGEAMSPVSGDGLYLFVGEKGAKACISVSCADGASAALRSFRGPGGFSVLVR